MGNLGQREKYGVIAVIILIIMFGIYFFGIRKNQADEIELNAKVVDLQNKINYYDRLKSENEQTKSAIKEVESSIADLESKFIPVIRTENIERYVINKFMSSNVMYLNSISSENAPAERPTLPNGKQSNDALLLTKVTVEYSTTDGLLPGAYNMTGEAHINDRTNPEAIAADLEASGLSPFTREYDWTAPEAEYNAFVSVLKQIEAENPDCIKISEVQVKSEGGYMLLSATINFYSALFTDRVSEPNVDTPYASWSGPAINSIGTDGFIGQRLLVDYNCGTNTAWAGTIMFDKDATSGDRPFTTYYVHDLFVDLVDEYGLQAVIYHEDIEGSLDVESNAPVVVDEEV